MNHQVHISIDKGRVVTDNNPCEVNTGDTIVWYAPADSNISLIFEGETSTLFDKDRGYIDAGNNTSFTVSSESTKGNYPYQIYHHAQKKYATDEEASRPIIIIL